MNVALSTIIVYMFSYISENCITNKFELFSKWFVFEDNCVGNAEIVIIVFHVMADIKSRIEETKQLRRLKVLHFILNRTACGCWW